MPILNQIEVDGLTYDLETPNIDTSQFLTVDLDSVGIGEPNLINADTLGGKPASDYFLKSELELISYKPNDEIIINQVCSPGFITTAGTHLYMSISLPKFASSAVKSVSIISGKIIVRGDKGYIIGNASVGDIDITTLNIINISISYNNLIFVIESTSGAYNATNNTPIVGYLTNIVLKFNG